MTILPEYEWLQEGDFADADGNRVRAYDDVVLLRDIAIERDEDGPYRIPAGTTATVLFLQREADGFADLECYWPDDSFSLGTEQTQWLRLHLRAEDKYPELRNSEGSVG